MSYTSRTYDEIGEVRYYKRKGQKNITLSPKAGYTRVSMPRYVPIKAGEKFLLSRKDWVLKHKESATSLHDGMYVGKTHQLQRDPQRQRILINDGVIYTADSDTSAKRGALKALEDECH